MSMARLVKRARVVLAFFSRPFCLGMAMIYSGFTLGFEGSNLHIIYIINLTFEWKKKYTKINIILPCALLINWNEA